MAHKHVSDRNPAVMRTWNKMLSEDNYVQNLVSDIASTRERVSPVEANKTLNKFSDDHQITPGSNDHRVENAASDAGFNGGQIEQHINTQKDDLGQKYSAMDKGNHDQHVGIKYGINLDQKGLQTRIDKYEEDRIGQGRGSKIVGGVLGVLTLGNAGWEIGGAQKDSAHIPAFENTNSPVGRGKTSVQDANKNSYEDLSDLAPNWIQYTGEKPAGYNNVPTKQNGFNNISDAQKVNPELIKAKE